MNGVDLVDFYKPDTTSPILQARYYRLERSGACIRAHPPPMTSARTEDRKTF